ncbi:MAG: hypothetical protein R3A51_22420 [Nannocystaceae bacterium]|nr:hypothetical protein [Myxococcales bacterium]
MSPRPWLFAAVLGLSACFQGDFLRGRSCEDDSRCGPSMQCIEGVCADPDGPDGPPGPVLWTRTIDASELNRDDEAAAVGVDGEGNVRVVGWSSDPQSGVDGRLVTLDALGGQLGTSVFRRVFQADADDQIRALAMHPDNSFVIGGHMTTSGNGEELWLNEREGSFEHWDRMNAGPGPGPDSIAAVAIAPDGLIFTAGFVTTARGDLDLWFARHNNGGNIENQWTVDGPGQKDDYGRAIALDPDGLVLVAGSLTSEQGDRDLWFAGYSRDGAEQWSETVDEDHGDDEAFGIAADSRGAFVVVGAVEKSGEGRNIWIRKLSQSRDTLWTVEHTSDGDHEDVARAVVIDSDDNVIVAGHVGGGDDGHADIWVRKLDGDDGSPLWTDYYNGLAFGEDRALGVTVDASDNVVAVGSEETSTGKLDFWVREYKPFSGE